MRRWLRLCACIALASGISYSVDAAAQSLSVGHGGFLRDDAGEPIDGEVTLTYTLFDVSTGGEARWTETHTLQVDDGVFSVVLGEQEAFSPELFQSYPLYLEIAVDGESLSPRSRLLAMPQAINALGDITPRSVSVGGVNVIAADGTWVGPVSGLQGPLGEPGPDGAQGVAGPAGPQGVPGAAGNTGPQGLQGIAGETGPQGLQGLQGQTGSQGLQGFQGLQGLQGEVGPPGNDGTAGEAGTPGQSVVLSSADPSDCPGGGIGLTVGNGATQHVCDGDNGTQPFAQNGSDVYYAQGKVGIGTQTPLGSLDVVTLGDSALDAEFLGQQSGLCDVSNACYQSFTALTTGYVTQIRVPICANGSDGGNIELFTGDCASSKSCDGSTGLLGTSDESNTGCDINTLNGVFNFSQPVRVEAGSHYTLRVTNTFAYTTHNNSYAGGAVYHPSINNAIEGDMPFQVHVKPQKQVVISDFVYFGAPEQDGTWRMGLLDGSFVFQARANGTWSTVDTLGVP